MKNIHKLTPNQRIIKLRNSVVNADLLRDRIRRFIRSEKFTSRYISLITKISANNGSFWRSIDRRTILDLHNDNDITNYINNLIRYTNCNIEDWYDGLKPECLYFEWINAKDKDYIIYQNNQKISNMYKKLDIKIDKPYNLPFDVEYFTWGNSINEMPDEIVIKEISFDDNIESIIVKEVDYDRTRVVINYKYGDIKSFIDKKLPYNNYLRSFSFGLEYYFNNTSNPLFYYEKMQSNDVMYPGKKTERDIKIATLDIETYIENNEHKILCICFYDGVTTHKFYISDYKDQKSLLNSLMSTILQPKYHNHSIYIHSIYIHNGSSFELYLKLIVFLLKMIMLTLKIFNLKF